MFGLVISINDRTFSWSYLNIEPGVFAALLASLFQSPVYLKVIVDLAFFSSFKF
jgi:hypothetical protein